jgi:hypothetical protein
MKKAMPITGWIAAVCGGLFVYYIVPEWRWPIAWVLGLMFAYKILSELVESAVRRVLWDDLLELRQQSHTNSDRLETVDRKVLAILKDALEHRRQMPGT